MVGRRQRIGVGEVVITGDARQLHAAAADARRSVRRIADTADDANKRMTLFGAGLRGALIGGGVALLLDEVLSKSMEHFGEVFDVLDDDFAAVGKALAELLTSLLPLIGPVLGGIAEGLTLLNAALSPFRPLIEGLGGHIQSAVDALGSWRGVAAVEISGLEGLTSAIQSLEELGPGIEADTITVTIPVDVNFERSRTLEELEAELRALEASGRPDILPSEGEQEIYSLSWGDIFKAIPGALERAWIEAKIVHRRYFIEREAFKQEGYSHSWGDIFGGLADWFVTEFTKLAEKIPGLFSSAWQWVTDDLLGAIKRWVSAIGEGIKNGIGDAIKWVRGQLNTVISHANQLPFVDIPTISAPYRGAAGPRYGSFGYAGMLPGGTPTNIYVDQRVLGRSSQERLNTALIGASNDGGGPGG